MPDRAPSFTPPLLPARNLWGHEAAAGARGSVAPRSTSDGGIAVADAQGPRVHALLADGGDAADLVRLQSRIEEGHDPLAIGCKRVTKCEHINCGHALAEPNRGRPSRTRSRWREAMCGHMECGHASSNMECGHDNSAKRSVCGHMPHMRRVGGKARCITHPRSSVRPLPRALLHLQPSFIHHSPAASSPLRLPPPSAAL